MMNRVISWQDQTQIQLKFRLFDPEKERRHKQRISFGPGIYEPTWTPKLSIDVGIRQFPFEHCWLMSYKKPAKCENERCGFSSPRKDRMKRHAACCRDTTEVVSKRVCYGLARQDENLSIPQSFFTNPNFYFAVFDIETAERPSDQVEVYIFYLIQNFYFKQNFCFIQNFYFI